MDFYIDSQGKGHPSEEKREAGKERGAEAVVSAQRTQWVRGGGIGRTESKRVSGVPGSERRLCQWVMKGGKSALHFLLKY